MAAIKMEISVSAIFRVRKKNKQSDLQSAAELNTAQKENKTGPITETESKHRSKETGRGTSHKCDQVQLQLTM